METTHIINHHYMTAHLLKEYCLCSSLLMFLPSFSSFSCLTLSNLLSFVEFHTPMSLTIHIYVCISTYCTKYEKNPILMQLNLLHLLMVFLLIFHSFHPISYLFIANILIGWLNIYGIFLSLAWSSSLIFRLHMCTLQTMYRIISYYSVWGVPRIFIDTREKSRFKILNYELV